MCSIVITRQYAFPLYLIKRDISLILKISCSAVSEAVKFPYWLPVVDPSDDISLWREIVE
jgi:hypothetical protein